MNRKLYDLAKATLLLALCLPSPTLLAQGDLNTQPYSINWTALNPARGEKSPQAANLWGDRKKSGASGFLVQFSDGFQSPDHIHNVSYRAVVISGHIHNKPPKSEKEWMSPGSFWTQPAGQLHITAAKGDTPIVYVEIDDGPYLVRPPEKAYLNGEKPMNIDASNIVWLNQSASRISNVKGIEIAHLWHDTHTQTRGLFIKIPAGKTIQLKTTGKTLHGIIIQGNPKHNTVKLSPGYAFSSETHDKQVLQSGKTLESIIYVRSNGQISIDP